MPTGGEQTLSFMLSPDGPYTLVFLSLNWLWLCGAQGWSFLFTLLPMYHVARDADGHSALIRLSLVYQLRPSPQTGPM
ncbi:hypothetical protein BJX96DRAFT_144482, partial [Aspergillus floccosus]